MPARRRARKRALDVLYESEVRGLAVGATLADRVAAAEPPVNPFTVGLVEGVAAHIDRIDALLDEHAVNWSVDRMPPVDRNLLRIGAYELLYDDDVPDAVAVSEAVELARELSTDDSPTFISGLLSKLREVKSELVL